MIYLDSAATTLQKPPAVARAVAWAINHAASPGRGGHRPAMLAGEIAYACREEAAALFHVPSPEQVVFTLNATHALNLAIHTLVQPGMRVLISGYEHNAVTRPLHGIRDVRIQVAAGSLFRPEELLETIGRALDRGEADVVVCTHVSNVFGYILPMDQIAQKCRECSVPLIVDASQSAGCLPIDFEKIGAAFIAMPGHKGLYGPQGTGLLLCGMKPEPLLQGGTGSESIRQAMPEFLPDRAEAGTHNVAGIAGLLEGLRYVRAVGTRKIAGHERHLIHRLGIGLQEIPGLELFCADSSEIQSGVLSFRVKDRDCEELCEKLGDCGIALRAGLHCAPLAHQTAGTLETGTVRASVSAFNTEQEILHTISALRRLIV